MSYQNTRKDELYSIIKIMLEDGYTIGEILQIVGDATDNFFD